MPSAWRIGRRWKQRSNEVDELAPKRRVTRGGRPGNKLDTFNLVSTSLGCFWWLFINSQPFNIILSYTENITLTLNLIDILRWVFNLSTSFKAFFVCVRVCACDPSGRGRCHRLGRLRCMGGAGLEPWCGQAEDSSTLQEISCLNLRSSQIKQIQGTWGRSMLNLAERCCQQFQHFTLLGLISSNFAQNGTFEEDP